MKGKRDDIKSIKERKRNGDWADKQREMERREAV